MLDNIPTPQADSGLACLLVVARLLDRTITVNQLLHERAGGDTPFSSFDMLCACSAHDLKGRNRRVTRRALKRLTPNASMPPPILIMRDHSFRLFLGFQDKCWIIGDPSVEAPEQLTTSEFNRRWIGRVVTIVDDAKPQSMFDGRWFRAELARHYGLVAVIVLCALFTTILGLATPLFIQVVVNKIVGEGSTASLTVMAIGLGIAYLATLFFGWLQHHVIAHVAAKVDSVLSARIFAHLLKLGLPYFEARQVGQTVARLRELETVRSFFTGSALSAPLALLFASLAFVVMLYYDLTLTLIVAAQLPVLLLLAVIATPALRRRIERHFQHGAVVHSFLVETVASVSTVKSMAVEPQQERRWHGHIADAAFSHFALATYSNSVSHSVRFVNQAAMFAVLVYGVLLVFAGQLSIGAFIAFHMIAGRVSEPILQLAAIWPEWQQVKISIARLGDVMNARVESQSARSQPQPIKGAITFKDVTFRYKKDAATPPVLSGIDLAIEPGEVVGIVGASGSGKSTLVKLVKRLYAPNEGLILIDGTNIGQMPLAWLRRQVGDVAQENLLFNRTIHDNIALIDPTLPRNDVEQAARMAGAHDFITALEEGYDTLIEERGVNLSGGQRQRIAIARTLITDPRILIFDEATSALDLQSEQVIQQNMAEMTNGRTVLIVAHRLAAIRNATRIIAMSDGRIVESGTHDELLKLGGHYAHLWALQSGGHVHE